MKSNKGISTVIVIAVIFLVGVTVGGVMYFVGYQNRKIEPKPTTENSQTPATQEDISNSLDENVIESELDNTKLDDVEGDLSTVDSDASKIK